MPSEQPGPSALVASTDREWQAAGWRRAGKGERQQAWETRWRRRANALRSIDRIADEAGAAARAIAAAAGLATGQGFVLSHEQARACGLSDSDIRRQVRRRWWRPRPGVLCVVRPEDDDDRHALAASAAAIGLQREVAVSGTSAATLLAIDCLSPSALPVVTFGRVDPIRNAGRRDRHTRIARAGLPSEHLTSWYGVPVTTAARTVVDIGRTGWRRGVAAADSALHAELTTQVELEDVAAECRRWPGIVAARNALEFANPLSESVLESLTRCFLHEHQFPTPRLQVAIAGYRVDLLIDEYDLILEADGLGKYKSPSQLREEKVRDLDLMRTGRRVEHLLWNDVFARADRTAAYLRQLSRLRRT
jgi:very-short-patch-repair endonuclease